jgi:DNA modification methylase
MKIEQRNPKELKHYKLNAKQHPEAQVKGIVESIKRFGFIQPVVVDKNDEIIIGHGRTMAAMQAGLQEVPTVKLENLTEQEVKALRLIDNRIAETGWDADLLKIDLENLDIDLKPFAVDFSAMMPEPEKEVVEDDGGREATNELTMKWGVELGQVWLLGDHRLLCGDSTKAEDVERLMAGDKPFVMVTDPPYGVNLDQSWRDKALGDKAMGPGNRNVVANDDRADWTEVWQRFPGDVAYVWHASKFSDVVMQSLRESGFEICQQIIWNKSVMVMGRSDYHFKHEPCWYAVKKGRQHRWIGDRKQTTVIDAKSPNHIMSGSDEEKTEHPTQKPVECMAYLMKNHAGSVYDPFLGSGTTLIAAEQLGRKCYGMEISPDYVAVILQRWADFTGKTPELAEV